jgi:uncharacterized protein
VDEEGASLVRSGVQDSIAVASSLIAFVETRAAFARRRRTGELRPDDHRRLTQEFETDWNQYVKIDVTESLVLDAARLAEAHGLRAYDAIHLASALALRGRVSEPPTFACWDRGLRAAVGREGLELLRSRP